MYLFQFKIYSYYSIREMQTYVNKYFLPACRGVCSAQDIAEAMIKDAVDATMRVVAERYNLNYFEVHADCTEEILDEFTFDCTKIRCRAISRSTNQKCLNGATTTSGFCKTHLHLQEKARRKDAIKRQQASVRKRPIKHNHGDVSVYHPDCPGCQKLKEQ